MDNRRTGRTTRMLLEALERAKAGEDVVVAASSHAHSQQLQDITAKLTNVEVNNYRYQPDLKLAFGGGMITFLSTQDDTFDWKTLSYHNRRFYPKTTILVDHYAIENTLALAFREVHRWDKDEYLYLP